MITINDKRFALIFQNKHSRLENQFYDFPPFFVWIDSQTCKIWIIPPNDSFELTLRLIKIECFQRNDWIELTRKIYCFPQNKKRKSQTNYEKLKSPKQNYTFESLWKTNDSKRTLFFIFKSDVSFLKRIIKIFPY